MMFQFHDGSIKGTSSLMLYGQNTKFQFHDGSIKGMLPLSFLLFYHCFNSTMVRLKESRDKRNDAIKLSFNSTMVRLKVERNMPLLRSLAVFQFHDGSIKGNNFAEIQQQFIDVSIPRWFD